MTWNNTGFHENCPNEFYWIGDGYCDDLNNVEECNYDGGDCCGHSVDTDFCIICQCHNESTVWDTNTHDNCLDLSGIASVFIGDGYCDDESNIEKCNYDGGDCCDHSANTDFCIKCECHNESFSSSFSSTSSGCIYVGDGYCDDFDNVEECNYDGGDCCDQSADKSYCEICQCYNESFSSTLSTTASSTTKTSTVLDIGFYSLKKIVIIRIHIKIYFSDSCVVHWFEDGFCDDVNNFEECKFDGGDCCLDTVLTEYCSICECHETQNHDLTIFPGMCLILLRFFVES